ncbi:acetyl-CoA synthetase-like protein [Xylaria nigripes]|nr:acetyl-CoA synthetase-like protein [Xylaria nigripes]
MASEFPPLGEGRMMPVVIDEFARNEPHRAYASIPRRDEDLSLGYEDITYEVLANAINKLAWIIDSALGKPTTPFESMTYLGAHDLRYYMIQMAACKTGHAVLFSSHLNSLTVHISLMEKVDCKSLFSSADIQVDDILAARPMPHTVLPELNELLDLNVRAEWYPYTKTYEEAANDPYLYIHTSGTTGDPKPVMFNHAMVHTIQAQKFLPKVEGRSHVSEIFVQGNGDRVILLGAPYHVMSALTGQMMAVLGGTIIVLPYRSRSIALSDPIADIFTCSKIVGGFVAPQFMEVVAKSPNADACIKQFKWIAFGGGELSQFAWGKWSKYTRVRNSWGATDGGYPPQLDADPEDHEYIYFDMVHSGVEFREVKLEDYSDSAAKLYEMVLTWTPISAPYSAHFVREALRLKSAPPFADHHVGDLWTPHPDPKKSHYAWRFAGRLDDVITLASAINVNTGSIEKELRTHSLVNAALVVGNKHLQPLALLELVPGTKDPEAAAQEVWRSVLEPLNAKNQSCARIASTHLLVVPTAGFVRTAKGSISKVKSERKFTKEIEEIYEKFGDVYHSQGRP